MAPSGKLTLLEKLSYGSGDFAVNLIFTGINIFLFIFYTDVFGLSAAEVGVMLGVSRILDAVVDPIVGMRADRTESRWGKFRPYILTVCGPFAFMGVLLFTTPTLDHPGKLIWAYVTYNLVMIFFSAITIPYTAMLGVISADPIERTKASAWKFAFAFAGVLAVQGGLLPLVDALGGGNAQAGWQRSFMVIGVVVVAVFLMTFAGTRERIRPMADQRTSVGRDLKDLFSNGPWIILVATTITWVLYAGLRGAVTAHYMKYFVGSQSVTLPWFGTPRIYGFTQLMSAFGFIGSVGAILGILLSGWFAGLVGKRSAFTILYVVAILATAAFYWIRADQLALMFTLQFVGSVFGAPLCVILWAMYADAADFSEWKKGRRATGLVFAASMMSNKFGWAVSGVVVGFLLNATGFTANVVQAPKVLHGLVMLMSLLPAGMGAVSLLIFLCYPLNARRLGAIQEELRQRRGEADAAALGARA